MAFRQILSTFCSRYNKSSRFCAHTQNALYHTKVRYKRPKFAPLPASAVALAALCACQSLASVSASVGLGWWRCASFVAIYAKGGGQCLGCLGVAAWASASSSSVVASLEGVAAALVGGCLGWCGWCLQCGRCLLLGVALAATGGGVAASVWLPWLVGLASVSEAVALVGWPCGVRYRQSSHIKAKGVALATSGGQCLGTI